MLPHVDGSLILLGDRMARALNDHDVVVGFRGLTSRRTCMRLRSTPTKTLEAEDLGVLPGHQLSQANDIDNGGDMVGVSCAAPPSSSGHAFVRLRGGVMQDLNDLIPINSGWVLTSALRINDAGQTLCEGYAPGPGGSVCVLSPYIELPPPFHDNFDGERSGLTGGTGWVWFGRPGTLPVPINPNELWDKLSPEKRDIILGVTMTELAGRVSDADARVELENAAKLMTKRAVDRWTE